MQRIIVSLVFTLLFIYPQGAWAAPHNEIYASLKSPGHENSFETVDKCGSGAAEEMRQEILAKLATGQTKDEIIASYVAKYGEGILAVPDKKGFDLTAWLVPPLALLMGTAVVYLFLTKWVRRHGGLRPVGGSKELMIDSFDEERLQEEIRKYL